MRYDPNIHHRRSIRLSGYDYSHAGNYFVTICVEGRECLFGEVVDGHMVLNDAGRMVEQTWRDLSGKFPTAQLDAMVVMPNHMHFVIVLLAPDVVSDVGADHRARPGEAGHAHGGVGSGLRVRPDSTNTDGGQTQGSGQTRRSAPTECGPSLPDMVQWFKSFTTARYRHGVADLGWSGFPSRLWQRNYYEHVVRDGADMERICDYIATNPQRWAEDQLHPGNPCRW